MLLLTFTPIKDYLIALAFTYMYYSQGVKNINRPLDPKAKEILLFETENEGKKIISNNVQDIAEILETKKKPSIVLDSYDERARLSFDK